MPRVARHAICNETDTIELRSIAEGDGYGDRERRRALCVILSAGGMPHKDVAARTGLSPNWVTKWVDRFNEEGVGGLFDRPRSGRRGGKAIDAAGAVRGVMSQEPPPGGWTARAVAERLGIGEGTVRGAARGDGIAFERTRSWEFDTSDELVARGFDVVGLYVSGTERAIVVRSVRGAPAPTGTGSFATGNSALARDVERASQAGPIGLAGVLELARDHAADGGRHAGGSRLDAFLDGLVSGLARTPGAIHTVVLMSDDPASRRLLRHPGICFVRVEGEAEWEAVVGSHLDVGAGGGEAASRLRRSLSGYLAARVEGSEAFAWSKRAGAAADAAVGADDAGAAGDGDSAVATIRMGAPDAGSSGARAIVTVEYVDASGESSSATVEVTGLADPSECDTSDEGSLLAFVSDLERCVIPAVDRAGRIVGEAALASASKKNCIR